MQRNVAIADDFYLFTRELSENNVERLLVVFYKGEGAKTLSLDLQGSSIEDAKTIKPLFGGGSADLNGGHLQLQMQPMSVAVYAVQ